MPRWTQNEFETAKRLRLEGLSCEQIGLRMGRTRGSVGKRLEGIWEGPKPDEWTKAQVDHLAENLSVPASLLVRPLMALGPVRSLSAIRSKKREFSDYVAPRQVTVQPDETPWPVLSGSDEERDAKFVRMVVTEALRLGLGRKEAA